MTDSNHTDTFVTGNSKVLRMKPGNFLKKVHRQEGSAEEIIQKLRQNNRQLRQELYNVQCRVRELEAEVVEQPLLKHNSSRKYVTSATKTATAVRIRDDVDHRDDDVDEDEYADEESDNFSVEVEAATVEPSIQRNGLFDNEEEEEVQSTSSSARTIPSGNDKKSKLRSQQLRLRLRSSSGSRRRNEAGGRSYFSRRHPMQKVSEINTTSLVDTYAESGDDLSTTSDLSSSISTLSTATEDKSTSDMLMVGRMLPLHAMKSLLRISSEDSDMLSIVDDESSLFGKI